MSEGSSNSSSNLAENLIQNEYPTYDELQKEFMKEVVMNAFLKVKIEELESKNGYLETEMATLNEDLKKVFIRITNKWKSNDYDYNRMTCCEKRCVHFYKLDGCCINGNGYVQIINESNMLKYNCCLKWKGKLFVCVNKYPSVGVENPFNRPFYNCLTYSMFYFEIKCQMEEDKNSLENCLVIGLNNNNCAIRFRAHESVILHKINYIDNQFRLTNFVWNDLDVFGCGLVYPPTKMQGKLPYIFFTQNGKQIGKAVLLKENYNTYFPYVFLKCCSVEANFGHDLNAKPLIYDVSKHVVAEEFYE